jgi:hypothetical protein
MRVVKTLVLLVALGAVASAGKPAAQGKTCDAKSACSDGLTCVAHAGGKSTCEIVCASKTKCPEDQRCVKDGAQNVCRPINDGVGL